VLSRDGRRLHVSVANRVGPADLRVREEVDTGERAELESLSLPHRVGHVPGGDAERWP